MKKYSYFVGLLVIHPLISARYISFTTSVKNIKDYSPPLEQAKHTQAVMPAIQSTPENKPNLIAGLYATEKSRHIPIWQLEDLALLGLAADTLSNLWRQLQGKSRDKIIPLHRRG